MKHRLFLTLFFSFYCLNFISTALQQAKFRVKRVFPSQCVNDTFSFIYNDFRFKHILHNYEDQPAFLVSLKDISSNRFYNTSKLNATFVLNLRSKDLRKLSTGPFTVSPANLNKIHEIIQRFSDSGSALEFVMVPRNASAKVIQAFADANIKVVTEPTSRANHKTDWNTFNSRDVTIVDLSTNGLDFIVGMGNYLDKTGKSLSSIKECLGIIPKQPQDKPSELTFDQKMANLNAIVTEYPLGITWTIERANLIETSAANWANPTLVHLFLFRMKINYKGEEGIDASGLYKDWITQIFTKATEEGSIYFPANKDNDNIVIPNPNIVSDPILTCFEFIGAFTAKAVLNGNVSGVSFPKFLLKMMLGKRPQFHDLANDDPVLFKSFKALENLNVGAAGMFTFSYNIKDENGNDVTVELVPGGSNIYGSEDNKYDYMELRFRHYIDTPQIYRFVKGFRELVKTHFDIDVFTPKELDNILAGSKIIDVADWRANTYYTGYTRFSSQIKWFWEIVGSMDNEQRRKLLKFATGLSSPPLKGFAYLSGRNGIFPFRIIMKEANDMKLPSSHTCFNQLDLPQYSSKKIMKAKLLMAIEQESFEIG